MTDSEIALMKNSKEGDVVVFGKSGNRSIKWIVGDKNRNTILLISESTVATRSYNDTKTSVTWKSCSLRQWLNNEFIEETFKEDERDRLLLTQVPAAGMRYSYKKANDYDTEDMVFLLSTDEANKYLSYSDDPEWKKSGSTGWWTRTIGMTHEKNETVDYTCAVCGLGEPFERFGNGYGHDVNETAGVRPAMWVNLE